ncbi:MAG: E22 family MetX-like putative esterase [Candidatus Muiribacteriota bacterium]
MLIENKIYDSDNLLMLQNGEFLKNLKISYQTYGKLNKRKDNAILVCHYFSGDKHIAGKYSLKDEQPGWWDDIVGPAKPLDTDKFFIISSDSLSCVVNLPRVKTTSPRSINPDTGSPYGMNFPVITIQDMVNAQKKLIDFLGVKKLHAVTGPSMGGLQALSWSVLYPEMVKKCIPIACAPEVDCFSSFFPLRMGIEAIKNDPYFNFGNYYDKPENKKPFQGLKNAINGLALIARGRNWGENILGGKNFEKSCSPFEKIDNLFDFEKNIIDGVSSRASIYDPNSYIYISKANIIYSMGHKTGTLKKAIGRIKSEILLIGEKNDVFIPVEKVRLFYKNLVKEGKKVYYFEFSSPVGHLGSVSHSKLFSEQIKDFL